MLEYLQPVIYQITSTRNYIIITLSQKFGLETRVIQYIIIFGILYLVLIFILSRIYKFFVKSAIKKKSNYNFSFDAVLYQYQSQNLSNPQDLSWIQNIIKEGSYDKSYKVLLEKASLLSSDHFSSQLKKSYNSYKSASSIKTLCGRFLLIITLGIYKLFL